MREREAVRQREPEPKQPNLYEELFRLHNEAKEQAETGKVLIRGKDQLWQKSRQGKLKWFLHPAVHDTAMAGWMFFLHEIHTHSGRHRHQGGLAIYVVEGKGYTTVNGQRVDWEEGDLLLLPITPGGVEHQHFNIDPAKPSVWLGIVPFDIMDNMGNELEQKEVSPDWLKEEPRLKDQFKVSGPRRQGGRTEAKGQSGAQDTK